MTTLQEAVKLAGGPKKAAAALGISTRYVHRLLERNALPRTEYTGETNYAEKLAIASNGQFDAVALLEALKPRPPERLSS